MKLLALVVLLATPARADMIRIESHNGYQPYANMLSTETQSIVSTSVAQGVTFSTDSVLSGFTRITASTYSVQMGGVYEFCVSAIADNTGGATTHIDLWFSKNGVNVPNSNTSIDVPNASAVGTMAVCWFEPLNANDTWELRTHAGATTANWKYLPAETDPNVPATPSVILTAKRVSR